MTTGLAPYSTIQSAIDAAVADGHNDANPAVVSVMPGVYVGDVTMAPGVHINGIVTTPISGCLLVGSLTIPGATAGSIHQVANLQIVGPSGVPAVRLLGTEETIVNFWRLSVQGDGASAIRVTNNNPATELSVFDSLLNWINPPVGGAVVDVPAAATGVTFNAFRVFVLVDLFTPDITLRLESGGTHAILGGAFLGQIVITGGTARINGPEVLALNGPAFVFGGGAVALLDFIHITHFGPIGGGFTLAAGAGGGTIEANALVYAAERAIDPTLVQSGSFLHYSRQSPLQGPAVVLTRAFDGVPVDAGGAGGTVSLPPLGRVPDGHEIWIKFARGLGGVVISPAAGQNIDDLPSPGGDVTLAALGDRARFEADITNNTWWRID